MLTQVVLGIVPFLFAGLAAAQERSYDVVISGAGTGGISAAIQAARMGAKVAVLEETDWIGGQMTAAGVSTMDEGHYNEDSGIYRQFISRVKAHYQNRGKSIGTCYWSSRTHCFEPHVGQKILYDMIAETKGGDHTLDLFLRSRVVRVLSQGHKVTGVTTADGRVFRAKVVVDASEYGDLLPMAPVRYRISRFTGDNLNPRACIQDITYPAIMKKYPLGVPPELWMKNPPPGYDAEVRRRFSNGLRKDGNQIDRTTPVSWAVHNAYRGVPDSSGPGSYTGYEFGKVTKTGINWVNDYPVTVERIEFRERKKLHCEAKLRTLQFLYYVQHELGEKDWAIANDEGYDTPYNREENLCEEIPVEFKAIEMHFPVMPYVRESRRLIGLKTLSAVNLIREGWPPVSVTNYPTAVAIGDYAMDLHNCNSEPTLEADLEQEGMRPRDFRFGRFQVVLEQFLPETADGFLVAEKNLSQSRYFNGATRLQPSTMLTGQAAGVIAALAVQSGLEPRNIAVVRVQKVLLEERSSLALPMLSDVQKDHPLWPAVQMAVLKEWIPVALQRTRPLPGVLHEQQFRSPLGEIDEVAPDGRCSFGIKRPLLRWEAALAVARCAQLGPVRPTEATFRDVPLFHDQSGIIEALARIGATPACRGITTAFCPDEPVMRSEFLAMLAKAVSSRPEFAKPDARPGPDAPLVRGEAAAILWEAATGR